MGMSDSGGMESMETERASRAVVTVILAVRNGGTQLRRAMDSVLQQSRSDLCLLVVDDASDDTTASILREYAETDGRVRVLRNQCTMGLTRSLNRAVAEVRTDWVARIDHDDTWCREKLERQLAFADRSPHVGLLGTAYREVESTGGRSREPVVPLLTTDEAIRGALYQFNPLFHSSILVRSDLLRQVGGYNEGFRYAQDYELWTRIATLTRMAILPDVLCYRGIDRGNISIRKERSQRLNGLRAKWAWARTNGFRTALIKPVVRDVVIMLAPMAVKKVMRNRMQRKWEAS